MRRFRNLSSFALLGWVFASSASGSINVSYLLNPGGSGSVYYTGLVDYSRDVGGTSQTWWLFENNQIASDLNGGPGNRVSITGLAPGTTITSIETWGTSGSVVAIADNGTSYLLNSGGVASGYYAGLVDYSRDVGGTSQTWWLFENNQIASDLNGGPGNRISITGLAPGTTITSIETWGTSGSVVAIADNGTSYLLNSGGVASGYYAGLVDYSRDVGGTFQTWWLFENNQIASDLNGGPGNRISIAGLAPGTTITSIETWGASGSVVALGTVIPEFASSGMVLGLCSLLVVSRRCRAKKRSNPTELGH
ncbi:hypothetical protein [Coraliomargarita parva]|uniref:hypothetical protein n=1 Tax=Coraliomargarita parva TaxID=3014050 RepID=UPI0022B596CE|nr:hypothetical protein [Coraliomargarita parva]